MFINTGGPLDCYGSHHQQQQQKQHRHDRRGELHLQCYHYHGHRHLRQSKQLHLAYWSGRLTAYRHLLFPDPLHRGSLSPAELLLKPGAHSPLFSASTRFLTSPHLTSPHLTSPPIPIPHAVQPLSETTRLTWMGSTTFHVLLK